MTGFEYIYDEAMMTGLLSGLNAAIRIPSTLLSIASYVLTALALYTLAKRRGLNKPWLAWIPVADCWLLGSLSDQYRYVVKGENKGKRKALLTLSIISFVLALMIAILAVVMVVQGITGFTGNVSESQILEMILGPALGLLGLCLPLVGVSIAFVIIRYMALYDVYKSMDPSNCVMFLVLSIIFSVTEPFFLFFNRNKDQGMPPRRNAPPQDPQPTYETVNRDYL